jgi:hypothetical protein
MFDTVMSPDAAEYAATCASKRLPAFEADTTTTELPTMYAKSRPTVNESDPPRIGKKDTGDTVAV